MPNLKNAEKALRQNKVRAERKALVRANIAFMRRSFRKLLEEKKLDEAKKVVQDLSKALDKAVAKNVYNRNMVARVKSRTTKRLNAATSAK